jgi:hypothetical protein
MPDFCKTDRQWPFSSSSPDTMGVILEKLGSCSRGQKVFRLL